MPKSRFKIKQRGPIAHPVSVNTSLASVQNVTQRPREISLKQFSTLLGLVYSGDELKLRLPRVRCTPSVQPGCSVRPNYLSYFKLLLFRLDILHSTSLHLVRLHYLWLRYLCVTCHKVKTYKFKVAFATVIWASLLANLSKRFLSVTLSGQVACYVVQQTNSLMETRPF